MSAPYAVSEKSLDENMMMVCRGCLAVSGEMKNMFEWGLAEDFTNCTNVQLKRSDSASELLCVTCEQLLTTCKTFRVQCQSSNQQLWSAMEKKKHECSQSKQDTSNSENTISCVLYDKKLIIMITAPNTETKIYLSCPYCQESYIKQKDLLLHLAKQHQINDEDFSIELQYYCSINTCSYFINSGKNKFFQGRKFLNQHIAKVHTSKVIQCNSCQKSFSTEPLLRSHQKSCNTTFLCQICNISYNSNEKLLVHLLRKHPDLHKQYKDERKSLKRKSCTVTEPKKAKNEDKFTDYMCDSPKRSFATQTAEDHIKNDVALPSWQTKNENFETKTDEISTQTVFEDLLSLKSQASEDESIFFSETVSLSDIQTQTFPLEFGLSRSHKETLTEALSPDLSMKETQTCFCLYDSPKVNYRLFDSVTSSPCSLNLATAETQTHDMKSSVKSDVLLSFNSAETQTSFEDNAAKDSF
ncbi:zinc-finger associated domain (zf-AD) domain-containing protein [Phthorimaea operculella]|nr:zinc-finger associated domain (zf-AD) domain-containing protein [Phthorimaea operculella]